MTLPVSMTDFKFESTCGQPAEFISTRLPESTAGIVPDTYVISWPSGNVPLFTLSREKKRASRMRDPLEAGALIRDSLCKPTWP